MAGRDALGPLESEWRALVERCERATLYQTWEWNEAWWSSFAGGKRLRLLLVRDGGALVGIAPLYVSWHFKLPLRRLAFLGTGAADYLDLIAPEERTAAVYRTVLDYLVRAGGFDLADLQQLRPESALKSAHSCREVAGARLGSACLAQEPCPYIPLPESWDALTKRLGKKMRSNISYYDRLLTRDFDNVEIGLAQEADLDGALDATFALHQQRWNARLLPGALASGRVREFHRAVAHRFYRAGWLRLHWTRVNGRAVAALYCFRYRHKYYYYLGGFAPDLGRYSLGTVLTARAIQQALQEGCGEFDFLRGAEPYKYRWMPEERVNERILVWPSRSLRSGIMRKVVHWEQAVEHRAKEFAERRGRRNKP